LFFLPQAVAKIMKKLFLRATLERILLKKNCNLRFQQLSNHTFHQKMVLYQFGKEAV
jgi:hypothetical protein